MALPLPSRSISTGRHADRAATRPAPSAARSRRTRAGELDRLTNVEPVRAIAQLTAPASPTLRGQAIRVAGFVLGGILLVGLAPGDGTLWHLGRWWADPLAYQRFTAWALMWELVGAGGGAHRTALRRPTALTHWLRVGTVRLPPWPGVVLATRGDRRGRFDVAAYCVALCLVAALVLAPARHASVPPQLAWATVLALVVVGLRDRTVFLAARPDLFLPLLLVLAIAPGDTVFAAKLCVAGWYWGRAVATMTSRYPAMLTQLASDTHGRGIPAVRRTLDAFRTGPLYAPAPSAAARALATASVVAKLVLPAVLLLSRGGTLTTVAVVAMVVVQLTALSSARTNAPVESTAFLTYSTVALFGVHAEVGVAGLRSGLLALVLVVVLAGRVLLGWLSPRSISPMMSLRWRSGTEAAGLWLVRDDLELPWLAGADRAVTDARVATRAVLPSVGALLGLLGRATDEPERYRLVDGEYLAGAVLGWSLGDGRLSGTALLDALRDRVEIGAGQLRLVTLSPQGAGRPLRYCITDAAAGKLEQGTVTQAEVARYRPFDAEQAPLSPTVTFQVLPPVDEHRARPALSAQAPDADQPIRLGADGAVVRVRPRPSRD